MALGGEHGVVESDCERTGATFAATMRGILRAVFSTTPNRIKPSAASTMQSTNDRRIDPVVTVSEPTRLIKAEGEHTDIKNCSYTAMVFRLRSQTGEIQRNEKTQ